MSKTKYCVRSACSLSAALQKQPVSHCINSPVFKVTPDVSVAKVSEDALSTSILISPLP